MLTKHTYFIHIKSSLLPIKVLLEAYQFKFFKRFTDPLTPSSERKRVFEELLKNPTNYLKHYLSPINKYANPNL